MNNLQTYLGVMENITDSAVLEQAEGVLKGFTPKVEYSATYILRSLMQPLTDEEKQQALEETNKHKCLIGRLGNEFIKTLPAFAVLDEKEFNKKRTMYVVGRLIKGCV